MPSISYLVTVHNETRTLRNLLIRLVSHCKSEDEIVILDDFSNNSECKQILSEFSNKSNVKLVQHALNKDYGNHKNYGNEQCTKEWIFQLDGDELPSEILLENIKEIINENPSVELYSIPRINDFKGVTLEHARQWGWRLTPCPACENRLIVQWPDLQGRLYKNIPNRIKWTRRLHEKIEGATRFSNLPPDWDLAIYHDKDIETQIKTNLRYNQEFTDEENRGHAGAGK